MVVEKLPFIRESRRVARQQWDRAFCRESSDKVTLGKRCPWTVLTRGLGPNSIVYSGGVGEDISFELELVERFRCPVYLYDPTPVAAETLRSSGPYRDYLKFKPVGLAGSDAPQAFTKNEGDLGHWKKGGDTAFPCVTISQELQERQQTHIDLLKIDIEGFEYEVLRSCLRDHVPITQICVEFHHFMKAMPQRTATMALIADLYSHGYRLVHKNQYDYTFYLAP